MIPLNKIQSQKINITRFTLYPNMKFPRKIPQISKALVEETEHLTTNILSPSFFMIHDPSRCG
ncbi:hypothetical protein Hanom_Chr05g00394161 [Helianthus anomalus]